jgi:hypothetical protein
MSSSVERRFGTSVQLEWREPNWDVAVDANFDAVGNLPSTPRWRRGMRG